MSALRFLYGKHKFEGVIRVRLQQRLSSPQVTIAHLVSYREMSYDANRSHGSNLCEKSTDDDNTSVMEEREKATDNVIVMALNELCDNVL